jgi:hypothetical protein
MPARKTDRARRRPGHRPNITRRRLLKAAAALPAAVAIARKAAAGEPAGAAASAAKPAAPPASLPRMRLGKHTISKLLCGSNCFNAGSHLSTFVNQEMRRYYTPEQVTQTLLRCEAVGVTCWQGSSGDAPRHQRYLDAGGKMNFIAISASSGDIPIVKKAGGLAIAHHGEVTDSNFKAGAAPFNRINDYLKKVRDAGLLVGVSTHMPDVIDAIESKGWDVDYYMACVYERHRGEKLLKELLGHVPVRVGEVYLTEDPPRMYKAIRQTKRPCLAFKILAAGRLSDRHEWVEQAFGDTFAGIKPTDGAIVGIYDRYSDQPAECAALVRRYAGG